MIFLTCLPCHCLALSILPGAKPWHLCWILRWKSFFLFHLRGIISGNYYKPTHCDRKAARREWDHCEKERMEKEFTNLSIEVNLLRFLPAEKDFAFSPSQCFFHPILQVPAHPETTVPSPKAVLIFLLLCPLLCPDSHFPRICPSKYRIWEVEGAADASISPCHITIQFSRPDTNFLLYKEIKISNSSCK